MIRFFRKYSIINWSLISDFSWNELIYFLVCVQEPETEAVSDEELPAAAPADLGETESVSEDELPPDSDKKKKGGAKAAAKIAEKKSKAESGSEYR